MPDVTEHHAKKEGKCDTCVVSRVNLLVGGNSVRVHYFLKCGSELSRFEVGWRLQLFKFQTCYLEMIHFHASG